MNWGAVSGAELYRIQVSTNEEFTNIVQSKSAYGKENIVLSTLANGTYYWRVKAGAVIGGKAVYNEWSEVWSVIIDQSFSNYPTEGDDVVNGTPDDDIIDVLAGNDIVYGNQGNDVLYGGLGNDIIYGGNGSDTLYGGEGNDVIYGDTSEVVAIARINEVYKQNQTLLKSDISLTINKKIKKNNK